MNAAPDFVNDSPAVVNVARVVGEELLREPLVEDALTAAAESRGHATLATAALWAALRGLEAEGYLTLDACTGWAPGPNLAALRGLPAALPGNVVLFHSRRGGAASSTRMRTD